MSPSTPSTKDGRRTYSFIAAAPGGSSRAISSVRRRPTLLRSLALQPRTSRSHNGRHDTVAGSRRRRHQALSLQRAPKQCTQTVLPKKSFPAAIRSDPQRPQRPRIPPNPIFFFYQGNSYSAVTSRRVLSILSMAMGRCVIYCNVLCHYTMYAVRTTTQAACDGACL